MKRRTLLAGTSSVLLVPVVGCLNNSQSNTENETDDRELSLTELSSEYSDECNSIEQPLSGLLSDDPDESSECPDNATPSIAIENERETDITVSVSIQSLTETYTLEPDERIVEKQAFETSEDLTGVVEVNGEEKQVSWPDSSCYRHGVAITATEIETGFIEPMRGPGDIQHDCYAGDDALLTVVSQGVERSITVTVSNVCTEQEETEVFDVSADDIEQTQELLTAGNIYRIKADVDGGESESYIFHDNCWRIEIFVEEEGEFRFIEHDLD